MGYSHQPSATSLRLSAILDPLFVFTVRMRSGAPFRTYVTASNLAFLVLVFRHYISRWKWEAARKRSKMAGLKRMKNEEEGDKPQLYYSGGLASQQARQGRFPPPTGFLPDFVLNEEFYQSCRKYEPP